MQLNKGSLQVQFILTGVELAIAQSTIAPKELEKVSDYSALEFEKYAQAQGYSPNSSLSTDTVTFYFGDEAKPNGKYDQLIRTYFNGMYSPVIQFATTDKQYYLDALNYVNGNGYTATKEEKHEIIAGTTTTWYYFANEEFTMVLYTLTSADNISYYNLQVFKNYGK